MPSFGKDLGPRWLGNSVAMFFTSSTTFVIPYKGVYRISAVGGGSGGAGRLGNSACPGGSGGGFCEKEAVLDANTRLILTVGAGGGRGYDGNAPSSGGNTTVIGGGVSLFAGGGTAPGAGGGGNGTLYAGGVGGIAYGGDINFAGGDGGWAKYYTSPDKGAAAGGGAAGSPFGVGGRGGNADAVSSASRGSGGAIGGFNGGDGTSTTNTSSAGTGGNGSNSGAVGGPNRLLLYKDGTSNPFPSDALGMTHSIQGTTASANQLDMGFSSLIDPLRALTGGASGGAGAGGTSTGTTTAKIAPILGGGPGDYVDGANAYATSGSIGGGGGGACRADTFGGYGGLGGIGLIVIERIG